MDIKTLSLPKLNQLDPSLESTALKLMEEAGELAQAIGKYRGLSGEKVQMAQDEVITEVAKELLDVAQTAVTMMFVLEDKFNINIDELLQQHLEKLLTKGYLTRE